MWTARLGEAANPGPVQVEVNSVGQSGHQCGDRRAVAHTQLDDDSDGPRVRSSGRFSVPSTDSEDQTEMGVVHVTPVSGVECDKVPVREVETGGNDFLKPPPSLCCQKVEWDLWSGISLERQ